MGALFSTSYMKCAFCDSEAVERGGEHIWDDWLNRAFPRSKRRFKYTDSLGTSRQYDTYLLNEKIPAVCPECNTQWMSQLTKQTKLTFESAIVGGSPLCVLPRGIVLLAAFTFMKAAVAATQFAEGLGKGDEAFFTRRQRERLRESLEVPTDDTVRMWIATFKGKALNSGRFVPAILSSDNPQLRGVQYFTITYMVGHLLLQFLAARWKDVRHRGLPLPMLRPDAFWDPACIQFWPPVDGLRVQWPPPKYFNDAGLEELINRFKLPINLPANFRALPPSFL